MRRSGWSRLIRLALMTMPWASAVANGGVATAQTLDDLFDDRVVHEVRLTVNERDLRELRERYLENVYVPADFQWRDQRVRNVGIRSRGLASRNASKLGLRIDFNRYTSDQRFLGLTSVVLDNLVTDPALIRERISMALFFRLGQPAPRESFARVFINGAYEGLYTVIEPVDGAFIARAFGEKGGYLFERHFIRSYYGEDLGDNPAAYRIVFEPRTHELEADTVLYSPIQALFREVNQPVDGVWRERVDAHIDLAQFVTHVAIETCLSESDGVLGFAGMANFYLYRGPAGDRHRFVVWDKDRTFSAIDSPVFLRAEENILFSRAITFGDLRALYLDVLEHCAHVAAGEGWMEREVTRLSTLIRPAAREDVHKPFDNDAMESSLAFLMQFARERPLFLLQEIARKRGRR